MKAAPKSSDSSTRRTSISPSSPTGQPFAQAMASSRDVTSINQKPPTNSVASANGPSMTVCSPPLVRTFAPCALGDRPSAASRTPAWTSVAFHLPISLSSSSDGNPPASDSALALISIR